jgi:hypothetical protein
MLQYSTTEVACKITGEKGMLPPSPAGAAPSAHVRGLSAAASQQPGSQPAIFISNSMPSSTVFVFMSAH